MNNSNETKQNDFNSMWLNSTFSNVQIKNNENVQVCIKNIFCNYLHFDNIKVTRIYDSPECSSHEHSVTLTLEYEDSTNLDNQKNEIQVNLDLLRNSFVPACINF